MDQQSHEQVPPMEVEWDLTRPIHVARIDVDGLTRTQKEFILEEFDDTRESKNLQQLDSALSKALNNIQSYGVFEHANILVDAPNGPAAVTVKAEVKEKTWYGLRTTLETDVWTGEQTAKLSGLIRNFMGRGEKVELSTSQGRSDTNAFTLSFSKPKFVGKSALVGNASIFANTTDYSQVSSFREHARGLAFSVNDRSGSHELGYEGTWRDILPSARLLSDAEKRVGSYTGASAAVVEASGTSIKSSAKYTYTFNRLNHSFVPTQGSFAQLSTEVAGLGGDVNFVKVRSDNKLIIPVTSRLSVGFSLMGGVVHPLPFLNQFSSSKATFLTDRFYFGTPLTMRGFERCSFGVVEHEDNLGGEVVAGAAASVSWAATKSMDDNGIRFHSFINAGNLVPLNHRSPLNGTAQDLYSTARLSVGAGIVIPSPIGRLEINLAKPIMKQPWDRTRRFQFGLDLQFH